MRSSSFCTWCSACFLPCLSYARFAGFQCISWRGGIGLSGKPTPEDQTQTLWQYLYLRALAPPQTAENRRPTRNQTIPPLALGNSPRKSWQQAGNDAVSPATTPKFMKFLKPSSYLSATGPATRPKCVPGITLLVILLVLGSADQRLLHTMG